MTVFSSNPIGPVHVPPYTERIREKYFTSLGRRGGRRRLYFLPGAVLKLGTNATERGILAAESDRTAAAARHPFWSGLPARVLPVLRTVNVARRYELVTPDDFPAVWRLLDRRLEACADLPPRPMIADVERSEPAVSQLGPSDLARLADLLGPEALPLSSMHGDLHFFNFVRSGRSFRIIDWEHFDDEGSFVFDYVDFHVSVDQVNGTRRWPDTLGALSLDHPAIQRAAAVSGASARALRAYYLMRKSATILRRRAEMMALDGNERRRIIDAIRNAIASLGVVIGHAVPAVL